MSDDIQIDLTEYNKLKGLLDKYRMPYEEVIRENFAGLPHYQLIYPRDGEDRKSDVVIGFGTYGWKDGLLEQMGLLPENECLGEDVQGWLDARTVFARWAEDFGYFVKGMIF